MCDKINGTQAITHLVQNESSVGCVRFLISQYVLTKSTSAIENVCSFFCRDFENQQSLSLNSTTHSDMIAVVR